MSDDWDDTMTTNTKCEPLGEGWFAPCADLLESARGRYTPLRLTGPRMAQVKPSSVYLTFCPCCGVRIKPEEHAESADCWCEPEVIVEDGGDVIVHRKRH